MNPGSSDVRVLYIIVNYRRAKLCAELACKVLELPGGADAHVLIVDNSETEEDRRALAALPSRTGLSCVTPPCNLGFYGGADFGLNAFLESAPLPDWVIVSNPDIEFADDAFLNALLATNPSPDVGALAPDIRLAQGKSQWACGVQQNPMMESRPSFLRVLLLTIFCRFPLLYWIMDARHRRRIARARPAASAPIKRAIHAAHGSAIVFARRYFESGGNLRHGAFLYGEELFVAEELRLRNLKCLFDPRLRLCHAGGVTTSALGRRKQRQFNYQALRFILKRYYSRAASTAKSA